jgi:hypothetical protein
MSFVRQLLQVKWWHMKSDEMCLSIARLPPWERYTASRTLRWLGHLHRMDTSRMTSIAWRGELDVRAKHILLKPCTAGGQSLQWSQIARDPEWRTPKLLTWERVAQRAIDVAVRYYPYFHVPQWREITHHRHEWRTFSACFDAGTSWDVDQRRKFFQRFRSGHRWQPQGSCTGAAPLLSMYY